MCSDQLEAHALTQLSVGVRNGLDHGAEHRERVHCVLQNQARLSPVVALGDRAKHTWNVEAALVVLPVTDVVAHQDSPLAEAHEVIDDLTLSWSCCNHLVGDVGHLYYGLRDLYARIGEGLVFVVVGIIALSAVSFDGIAHVLEVDDF